MHFKYFDILEYFRESQKPKDVEATIKEFQNFNITYKQMKLLLNMNFKQLDLSILNELPSDQIEMLKLNSDFVYVCEEICYNNANEIFMNAKHINIELIQYAMELCDKDEKK